MSASILNQDDFPLLSGAKQTAFAVVKPTPIQKTHTGNPHRKTCNRTHADGPCGNAPCKFGVSCNPQGGRVCTFCHWRNGNVSADVSVRGPGRKAATSARGDGPAPACKYTPCTNLRCPFTHAPGQKVESNRSCRKPVWCCPAGEKCCFTEHVPNTEILNLGKDGLASVLLYYYNLKPCSRTCSGRCVFFHGEGSPKNVERPVIPELEAIREEFLLAMKGVSAEELKSSAESFVDTWRSRPLKEALAKAKKDTERLLSMALDFGVEERHNFTYANSQLQEVHAANLMLAEENFLLRQQLAAGFQPPMW